MWPLVIHVLNAFLGFRILIWVMGTGVDCIISTIFSSSGCLGFLSAPEPGVERRITVLALL